MSTSLHEDYQGARPRLAVPGHIDKEGAHRYLDEEGGGAAKERLQSVLTP